MTQLAMKVCGFVLVLLGWIYSAEAGTKSDCFGNLQVVWMGDGSYTATLSCIDECDGHDCDKPISPATGNPFCMCPNGNNECTLSWEGDGTQQGGFLLRCLYPCSPEGCMSINGWGHGHQWFQCECAD